MDFNDSRAHEEYVRQALVCMAINSSPVPWIHKIRSTDPHIIQLLDNFDYATTYEQRLEHVNELQKYIRNK